MTRIPYIGSWPDRGPDMDSEAIFLYFWGQTRQIIAQQAEIAGAAPVETRPPETGVNPGTSDFAIHSGRASGRGRHPA